MELRKLVAIGLGIGAIALASVLPATAHSGPSYCVLAANTANVDNVELGAGVKHSGQQEAANGDIGLYYPPLDPATTHWTTPHNTAKGPLGIPATIGDDYTWSLNGACAVAGQASNPVAGATFTSGGTGIGYCGRSIGAGTGSITGGHTYTILWESAASQLLIHDGAARQPTAGRDTLTGSVNAQPNPVGSAAGSCTNGSAVQFLVDGILIHNNNRPA